MATLALNGNRGESASDHLAVGSSWLGRSKQGKGEEGTQWLCVAVRDDRRKMRNLGELRVVAWVPTSQARERDSKEMGEGVCIQCPWSHQIIQGSSCIKAHF